MICAQPFLVQTDERSSLSAFLPLAVAGFTTAFILGVQWLVGVFFHREQVPCNTNTSESRSRDHDYS